MPQKIYSAKGIPIPCKRIVDGIVPLKHADEICRLRQNAESLTLTLIIDCQPLEHILYKPSGEIDEDEEAYLKDAIKAISDLAKIALHNEGSRDCVFPRDRQKKAMTEASVRLLDGGKI